MKKLQCEICGGALVMQDGMAVCESCGMKFSKEEVKKMVVELSGPIQIDGEVKVSGVDDADALYQRAKDYERIGEMSSAEYTYRDATWKYPGDARLWLGLATVQVKIELEKCEKELKKGGYYTSCFKSSFGNLEWCDGIEKSYARAQSLGGVADEAQQGLVWFQNQKELLLRNYKFKDYWAHENARFMTIFPHKEEALAFLLKRDVKELHGELKQFDGYYNILDFDQAIGGEIWLRYERYDFKYVTGSGRVLLPEGMTIQGDIRPMMDGFTYKTGLFGGKKTYSYANDPDKDKGPTFDE
ncbi:DUF2318 domain-containing protein [Intestinimonas massiliensis (ex Afouda et al. 2020)]|uniref:DUF2318 domain-containing protein n=1 Tax=Intestinimonas massiliensis (ex Afouda et al. 2020) TaxID=1673721 RepID=A0ABS9M699_9FIRM|nr:DUF2318 domain-containing protein [Intestinimonas massiliensis (ex Afouda et al. 2020)]MCG4526314.1 DUF2318 domain-containing protein [Intestinimonas massiliensis (ex Afouda et al. 2020)]